MMATSIIEEIKKHHLELQDLKEELIKIKIKIISEKELIQILKNELNTQECKYKCELEKIQRQISQIKIYNNSDKSSGLDFSDFQMPPDLPWGSPLEPRKDKEKNILTKQ